VPTSRLGQFFLATALASSAFAAGASQSSRKKICISTAWRFHLGDPDQALYAADLDDSGWDEISVPHTLKLTSLNLDGCQDDKLQSTFHRTVGWYRKSLRVTDNRKQRDTESNLRRLLLWSDC
jgi:hypothetical protein